MSNNKVYLLAYPRSGSSFIRYSLGYLSQSKPMQPEGHSELDIFLKDEYINKPFFTKFHYPIDANKKIEQNKNNTLVLLRRDPLENILSYAFSNENINKKNFSDEQIKDYVNNVLFKNNILFDRYYSNYVNNVRFYREWKHEKRVISYENFISNPEEEILKIKNIFNISNERLKLYLDNIDYHKSLILSFKSSNSDPFNVNTKGNDNSKFKKLLTDKNFEFINEKIISDGL